MSETNQNTSLTQAINDMRTMRESYNQLGAAAEAYNAGKSQLVENLNFKGVPASASETLPELADKVAQIAQTETILEGGEVMAAQQFGDGALWNLYQVLADIKTRFMGNGDYAALIVCEYYKGYDSLQLQGADAYYTCDGDLYEYASPNHVWHDSDNGKTNRWVAFLYRDEGARLEITNTAISPRSMYIGGHIGTIEYFVDGRLTELVCGVEETDVVDNFLYTNNVYWEKVLNIRNVKQITAKNDAAILNGAQVLNYFSSTEDIKNSLYYNNAPSTFLTTASFPKAKKLSRFNSIFIRQDGGGGVLNELHFPQIEEWIVDVFVFGLNPDLYLVEVGEVKTNMRMYGWNPTNYYADAVKKAQLVDNFKKYILARVSDRTGLSQLVLTLSANFYNNIASEQIEWQGETMSLADAFLTKNWLLAGA